MILYARRAVTGRNVRGNDRIWSLPGSEPTLLSGFTIVPRYIHSEEERECIAGTRPLLLFSIAWAPALQLWLTILMMATTQVLPLPSLFKLPFLIALSLFSPCFFLLPLLPRRDPRVLCRRSPLFC